MTVVTGHRPHLAMTPRGMGQGMLDRQVTCCLPGRARPRPLQMLPSAAGPGLPAPPRALGHVEALAEPRGRHARLHADHLEVLEGPSRPSADFFHTRISTARLTQRLGQFSDLCLQLLLPAGRTRLTGRQSGFTGLQEIGLPPPDRLLTDLLPTGRLSDTHLPGQHTQHDPGLLLNRNLWGSSHDTDSPSGLTQPSCH